uniref:Uncharacterized protein n=1 Tax=Onchocerca volvulus TaxID=6282 RepID=A0A8R1Y2K0_ONCVO
MSFTMEYSTESQVQLNERRDYVNPFYHSYSTCCTFIHCYPSGWNGSLFFRALKNIDLKCRGKRSRKSFLCSRVSSAVPSLLERRVGEAVEQ